MTQPDIWKTRCSRVSTAGVAPPPLFIQINLSFQAAEVSTEPGPPGRAPLALAAVAPRFDSCFPHISMLTLVWQDQPYFDVPVEPQRLRAQDRVLVLELVSRQQFGGAVAELQTAAFGVAPQVAG